MTEAEYIDLSNRVKITNALSLLSDVLAAGALRKSRAQRKRLVEARRSLHVVNDFLRRKARIKE